MTQHITVVYQEEEYQIVEDDRTGYFYPQYLGKSILQPETKVFHYYYCGGEKVSEPTHYKCMQWFGSEPAN